jgi:acyl-CoA dehydrogenase
MQIEPRSTKDMRRMMWDALDYLTPHRELLRELASSGGRNRLSAGLFCDNHSGASVGRALSEALADLCLDLDLHIYVPDGVSHQMGAEAATANQMYQFARRHVAGRNLAMADDFPHDLWREIGQADLFEIGLPSSAEHQDGGYGDIAAAERALVAASGSLGFGMSWTGHQMTARFFIDQFADVRQKQMLMPGLASGALTVAVAISEPNAGAHPKLLKTTARRDGSDYVIDGEKLYVTNGPIADWYVVLAITAIEDGRKRYSALLVPRAAPGLEIVPMAPMKALKPSPHCGLKFTACRVPAAHLLGDADTAYETMALPFRDVEDAVGTAGLAGGLRYAARLLAKAATQNDESNAAFGELAGLLDVLDKAADACVAEMENNNAALLVGFRVLATQIAAGLKGLRYTVVVADTFDVVMADIEMSLGIARQPRQIKQSRLGAAFIADK